MENLFIQASKLQLRFSSSKGLLSTEDLWTLSLRDLDKMAVKIHSTVSSGSSSFLKNPNRNETAEHKEQKLRLEILKAVIDIKQNENEAKLEKSKTEAQKTFLKDLLQKKKLEEMESLSTEDIEKQLAALAI